MNDSKASESNHASILIGDKHYPLSSTSTTIGRHPLSDVYIDDPSLSSHHAVIKKGDDGFVLVDMNSLNGTFVNGEKLSSPLVLSSHDQICFGSMEAILVVREKQVHRKPVTPPPLPSQKKVSNASSLPFTWWPRNKIISCLAALWLGLVFIFNVIYSPIGAVFMVGVFYFPMTLVRYARYRYLGKAGKLPIPQGPPARSSWIRPVLIGLSACGIFALIIVSLASSGTNSERQQVREYKALNEAAYNEHNSLGNIAGTGIRSGIHAYYGDVITPVAEAVNHYETSEQIKANIARAEQYDSELASHRQNDGGVIFFALLILLIPTAYVGWKLWKWSQRITKAVMAMLFLGFTSVEAQTTKPLSLDNGWLGPIHSGAAAAKELGALLSPFAQPSPNLTADADLEIYRGVTYLMPLNEARAKLGLPPGMVSKIKVTCGGFPKDSIVYYSFTGVFEGGYNQLNLLTDRADQVVAVQLVCDAPRRDMVGKPWKTTDWGYYNFVSNRRKATSRIWVQHEIYYTSKFGSNQTWRKYTPNSVYNQQSEVEKVFRIDSSLFNPDLNQYGHSKDNWRFLEVSRLYLPKPFMELMLHCIANSGSR